MGLVSSILGTGIRIGFLAEQFKDSYHDLNVPISVQTVLALYST